MENSAPHPSVFSTSFGHQFSILLCRNFHNARRRILNPISLIQNLYILAVCVLIWWRPERIEKEVMDRMGLVRYFLFATFFKFQIKLFPIVIGFALYRSSFPVRLLN